MLSRVAFACALLFIASQAFLAPAALRAQPTPGEQAAGTTKLAGYWQGTLEIGQAKLRLGVELAHADGKWTGAMDSPDQLAFGISIDQVEVKGKAVKLVLKSIGGTYEGTLSHDEQEIKGNWSQGGGSLALVLRPCEKLAARKRPQEPKPPFPYAAEEVTYINREAGIKIAGTLTMPKEGGRFPAVLLITGSGSQDRNEEIMGHKPFLVWADYLTRRGIAVLRVDDRGVGGTGGDPLASTIENHIGDALAGVTYLKSRPDMDPRRIGLMGHSEGGLVAPAAAVRSSDVAFIVLLAGPGVPGEEILYKQAELLGKPAGMSAAAMSLQKKLLSIIKEEQDDAAANRRIDEEVQAFMATLTADERKLVEQARQGGEAQTKLLLTPWFRHFLTYDPRPALERVKCPLLAIFGEKDLQVDPKQNIPPMEAALKASGNQDFLVRELAGLNHLFQASKGAGISEYGEIEETINPAALEVVGDWIVTRVGNANRD